MQYAVLIWLEIVTTEAFLFNCLHNLISSLFIFTVKDIKSRGQEKHVSYAQTSVHSYLRKRTLCFNAVSTIFQQASNLSLLCMLSSLFCSLRKHTSKNLPLVLCFGEISAENQQKFDSSTTSALYMLNDWV